MKVGRLLNLEPRRALVVFVLLDMVCFGIGMGVPVFCILFGFPVGWYIVRNLSATGANLSEVLKKVLPYAVVTSAFTFVLMAAAWGRCISWLFDPNADFANSGIPLILFEPRASFIGWLVLMIVIAPFLQLLTTLFASHLTLLSRLRRGVNMR
ncbi:MAG: hypothetical protein ACE5JA_09530 [bacterium]